MAAREPIEAEVPQKGRGQVRELLAAERLLLESRGALARAAPYLLLFFNLFANGYLHPLLRDDPTGRVLALFFFLKSSLLGALFLLHYLSVSEAILRNVDHLPVPAASRYCFAFLGGLRTPGVAGLLATDVLFLAVILGATPRVAGIALCAMLLLGLSTLSLATTVVFLLRRSRYPVTALAALGGLAFLALGTALVTFRAGGLFALAPLVWLSQAAIGAASHGATEIALGWLSAMGLLMVALFFMGRRIA